MKKHIFFTFLLLVGLLTSCTSSSETESKSDSKTPSKFTLSFDTSDLDKSNENLSYSIDIYDEEFFIEGNWNNSERKSEFDEKLKSEERFNIGERRLAQFDLKVLKDDEFYKSYQGTFAIEPGDLKIKITENGVQMSGTKINDLIDEFRNKEFESEEAMDSYINKMIKNDDLFASYLASIQLFKKLIELESTPQVSQLAVKEQIDKIINSYPPFVKQHYTLFNKVFDSVLMQGDIPPEIIASALEYFL